MLSFIVSRRACFCLCRRKLQPIRNQQVQSEDTADSYLTNHCQLASESFRDSLRNRQSQPRPVNLRCNCLRTTIKRLENLRQIGPVNSHSVICNTDYSSLFASCTFVH